MSVTDVAPLVLSVGDPAGIGPEVAVAACESERTRAGVVLVGDPGRLSQRLSRRARTLTWDEEWRLDPGEVALLEGDALADSIVDVHAPTLEGGHAQLAYLDTAAAAVLQGKARALVTGPTSKEAISMTGVHFSGQTEHLARAAGLASDDVTMMFLGPRLRVALVTTHLAVSQLSAAITGPRVERTIRHLAESLGRLHSGPASSAPSYNPRLAVTGLNPHAGGGGLFGTEEADVIAPAIKAVSSGSVGFDVMGPIPAEAAFRQAVAGRWDGVVAMMHDQATIASKLMDFGDAVNVTWGLPFVRASVDHGVAYDAAKSGGADAAGMVAALRMAERLEAGSP